MPRKRGETLKSKLDKIALQYEPYQIQRELAKIYYGFVKSVEPDYHYVPKDERDNGFTEPSTTLGKYFVRCWLSTRNLSIGMEKWKKRFSK